MSSASRRYVAVIHHPVFGGPQNEFAQMAQPLAERGWEGTIVLPAGAEASASRLAAAGLEVVLLPLHRLRGVTDPRPHLALAATLPQEVGRLVSVVKSRNADVVVNMGLVNPHAAIAGRLARRGVVWQLVDASAPVAARRPLTFVVRRLADVCMTNGQWLVSAHPGIEVFGADLVVFHAPVNTAEFAPDRDRRRDARRELGIADGELVVGMTANLSPEKDHRTFIRAAAELRRQAPSTRFVLLGATYPHRSSDTESLWALARELGVPVGEAILHRDAGDRVSDLAQAFDVFWLTSKAEGIPTVVVEAMALELPVVATDVGGVPEAVVDGRTGVLVPPADYRLFAQRTLELMHDPERRRKLGEVGREVVVEQFSRERCADVHARVFTRAAELAGRSPE
jgi:glycosyltransferase involved in cell wall biosynthesis